MSVALRCAMAEYADEGALQELRMDHMWSVPEAPLSDDWYDEYKVDAIREENRKLGLLDAIGDSDDEESSDMEAPTTEHIQTTAAAPELPVTPPSGDGAAVDGSADEDDQMVRDLSAIVLRCY